ncbi:MAG TPA: winged helix DNA-binding domain-containing protein [Candidatus Dormibacteraeota bacterium]|nr:winged helix DNA-binding domain-containing protein [Candidatus Dormibacteraeota bacterium]
MKRSDRVEAELSWAQVHAFRLQRHHLSKKAPKEDLARVVGDIGGAQAQVMSAAELQIVTRVDCTVDEVRKALWTDRTLVKTWLMRGTLHLARSDDLPVFVGAMGRHWVSQMRPSWLQYMQVTEKEFWAICDEIGAALNGTPLTREELIATVGRGRSDRVRQILRSGWGGMLKPAARNGLLCFGPSRGQSVTFVRPRAWLPSWRTVDPEKAITEMARRYLRVYGPANKVDFARWWGAWPGVANAAWKGLERELVTVSVEGARAEALAHDVPIIQSATITEPVQLLPLFDPYLMGYAKRDHLVEKAFATRVSRIAGWISAVVLLKGTVAGTWTHALKNQSLQITVSPFRRLGSPVKSDIKERAGSIAQALGAKNLKVTFD